MEQAKYPGFEITCKKCGCGGIAVVRSDDDMEPPVLICTNGDCGNAEKVEWHSQVLKVLRTTAEAERRLAARKAKITSKDDLYWD